MKNRTEFLKDKVEIFIKKPCELNSIRDQIMRATWKRKLNNSIKTINIIFAKNVKSRDRKLTNKLVQEILTREIVEGQGANPILNALDLYKNEYPIEVEVKI